MATTAGGGDVLCDNEEWKAKVKIALLNKDFDLAQLPARFMFYFFFFFIYIFIHFGYFQLHHTTASVDCCIAAAMPLIHSFVRSFVRLFI